ncbi:unnamed protein product [Peniophora sp. CBMAI 1063]|nr:unnamed protein product [Peniophora sp. CBMAI 1063]
MGDFAQSTSVVDSLRSIINQYPHGVGTFRELLQNSDDAGASEQVFVLDRRVHPAGTGFDAGPAFLAYNNALVTDNDWVGLQKINSSPKRMDTEKTGKYGLGFRSTFHITDTPEILSGRYLATFDPLKRILATEGTRRDFIGDATLAPHLNVFRAALDSTHDDFSKPLDTTIIRLPLRTDPYSELAPRVVTSHEIHGLLEEFIREEIGTVMLFLRHLSSIVVKEVDERGVATVLATATLQRSNSMVAHDARGHEIEVEVVPQGVQRRTTRWLVVSRSDDLTPYAAEVSRRVGNDVATMLTREKLVPDIALAVPIAGGEHVQQHLGRLYTFLPLPITTGFPCLINASFSLTPDRQSLRNAEEHAAEGSSHHVLVEWNKLLFSKALPTAWAALLSMGADRGMDVYSLWPGSYSAEAHGQAVYWNKVPVILATEVHERALPIWPRLLPNSTTPAKIALSAEVLVVDELAAGLHLTVFSEVGVKVCRIPARIQYILAAARCPVTVLSPSSAHPILSSHIASIEALPRTTEGDIFRGAIIDYQLLALSLQYIVNLPLIVAGDTYIALERSSTVACFIFGDAQAQLFRGVVALHSRVSDIPSPLLQLLHKNGPWNIARPGAADIKAFVERVIAQNAPNLVTWSGQFWSWLSSLPQHDRTEHFNAVWNTPILPTSNGVWQAPSAGVYPVTPEVERTELRGLLEGCGLAFLHPSIQPGTLSPFNCLWSIRNAKDLINQLARRPNVLSAASDDALEQLHTMLGDVLATYRFSHPVSNALRGLPIFPALSTGLAVDHTSRQAIAGNAQIYVVQDDIPLPDIARVCFLPKTLPRALIRALNADDTPLSIASVLVLALDNFDAQTPDVQAAFVKRICEDAESLPRLMTTKLSSLRFVLVANGRTYARPGDVIDPNSKINGLLESSSERVAFTTTIAGRDMIGSLSQLGLLTKSLTPAIACECIARISSSADSVLAARLFSLMNVTHFDASSLGFDPAARWIPCEDGRLYAVGECRDDSREMLQGRALFDRVLSVATTTVVSPSLRRCFGWDVAIPLHVLKRQFAACVAEEPTQPAVLQVLVQALASRSLASGDLRELQSASVGRHWVPVDNDECSSTPFAVFELHGPLSPFRKIQSRSKLVRSFLQKMGCSERPQLGAILQVLQMLHTSETAFKPSHVVALLQALDVKSLDSQTTSCLPIPTDGGELHACSEVYYNDLGSRAYLVQLPNAAHRAHACVTLDLAHSLAMKDLSSLGMEDDDEEDMGEALSTRIANVLRQYNQDQMPTEFLANAVDAGASAVSFMIDEVDFSDAADRLIVPSLAQLQAPGALVIHNDACFSDNDWKGIRRVGQGSKRNQPGNIGRFGLGALAAYHFSEATMIISGEYFLLLDPSRRFLGRRASRRVKLRDMRILFPDQLVPFVGLHGFEADTVDYHGTLFRLPLRSRVQAQTSELSTNIMSVEAAYDLLVRQETRVKLAVLFNARLNDMTAAVRSSHQSGTLKVGRIWHLHVSRDIIDSDDHTLPSAGHSEVTITSTLNGTAETWRIGLHPFSKSLVPNSFHPLFEKYLLPDTLSVGVALPRQAQAPSQACSLFSHLPLPITTTLSFHVHASFILAEDRRSIRLDDTSFANSESAYNRYLLSSLVPNLYLSVLHHWPTSSRAGDSLASSRFWPSPHGDRISQLIVDPLYRTAGEDSRAICESVTGARVAPSDAIFTGGLHGEVVRGLELLQPPNLVTKPATALERTSIRRLDAGTARVYVSQSESRLSQLYAEGQITIPQLLALIRFILGNDQFGGSLNDLRLLPLADGSLVQFRQQPKWGSQSLDDAVFMLPSNASSARERLFAASRFVHPDASDELRLALPHSILQVKPFNDDALAYLVGLWLQPAPEAILTEQTSRWVHNLWTLFSSLHSQVELHKDLRVLPLVSVSGQQHRHISVASCGGTSTLLATSSTPPNVVDALSAMGASFIDKERLPSALRAREPVRSMTFSFSSVLQFLERHLRSMTEISAAQAAVLRAWIRAQVRSSHKLPPEDIRIALLLPLFPVRNSQEFAAANNVQMLPPGVHIEDVLPLTLSSDRITPYDVSLANMFKITSMSFDILGHMLSNARRLGQVINRPQVVALANLLRTILSIPRAIQEMRQTLQVPNTHGVYVRPDTLYSRGVAMFVSAFDVEGRRPDVFVHTLLAEFDPRLDAFGMRVVENADTFRQCALAIQDATDESKSESARVVYEYYRDRLPWVRGVHWEHYDAIRFIPRAIERRPNVPAFNAYAREFPEIVSPGQLLRADLASIAWTQRALFESEPSPRLAVENAALGVPTAEEVVAHIRVLSGIPGDLDNRAVIAKDVKASYKFLQDRIADLSDATKQELKRGNLFLNVDNHLTEWAWCSAADLILNASDDGPTYKRARASLKNYSKLLRALGVHMLDAVNKPTIQVTGIEGELKRLRGGFDAKRRAEIGIDVVFIDTDEVPGRHPAHKIFLSACASYFDGLFYQAGMRESVVNGFAPVEVEVQTSGGALRRCLDYMYTGNFAPIEREDLQILLDMLAQADYWSLDDLKATVQGDLVVHLSPRVYEDVRGYAERYNADILLRSCDEWEAKNRDALRRGVDRSED